LDKYLALFRLEITVYTTRFYIRRILLLTIHSFCVFCNELRTNSNFFPQMTTQHYFLKERWKVFT